MLSDLEFERPGYKTRHVYCHLDEETYDLVEKTRFEMGLKRSTFIRYIVTKYVGGNATTFEDERTRVCRKVYSRQEQAVLNVIREREKEDVCKD